jgi:hypothetical protein
MTRIAPGDKGGVFRLLTRRSAGRTCLVDGQNQTDRNEMLYVTQHSRNHIAGFTISGPNGHDRSWP